MLKFDIAGINIEVMPTNKDLVENFEAFSSNHQGNSDLSISLTCSEVLEKPQCSVVIDEDCQWLRSPDGDSISVCIFDLGTNEMLFMLQVDNSWRNAHITCLNHYSKMNSIITGRLGEVIFRNRILFQQGIVIHAAAIEWEGKGIMFSAPSETGKSTQAELWNRYMGANILNGDRPAVRIIDNQAYVYGTPWSGSSPKFLNTQAPLSAIIILEQAKENSIRKLAPEEVLTRLMPRCFLPYYDDGIIMNLAIDNLERIISLTPIYLLKCKPDREAVELVYECVK